MQKEPPIEREGSLAIAIVAVAILAAFCAVVVAAHTILILNLLEHQ